MNNLYFHPTMKASDVQALMASIGKKVVARDSNIVQLRTEQEKRKQIAKPTFNNPEAA